MHISNEQLETYRRQGFLIVENFLQAEEREAAMTRFLVEASPRQRKLLGFPPPGDPLWTPGFDPNPTTLQEVTHESSEKNSRHRVGSSACGTLPVLGPGRPPGRRRRRSKRRATARIHGAESGRPAD